jgi:hypothetical protein
MRLLPLLGVALPVTLIVAFSYERATPITTASLKSLSGLAHYKLSFPLDGHTSFSRCFCGLLIRYRCSGLGLHSGRT